MFSSRSDILKIDSKTMKKSKSRKWTTCGVMRKDSGDETIILR